MYKLAAKILILFFISGALTSPVSEDDTKKDTVHVDKNVKEFFGGSVVGVPGQINSDEGIQIPVHVIHEVREAKNIDNNDVNEVKISHREEALVQKLNTRCTQKDLSSCVMLKLVTYMNRLLKKNNIEVYDGVQITQSSSVVVLEDAKPEDARADKDEDSQAMELITEKVWSFVKSRSLRWNIVGDADVILSTVNDDQGSLKVGFDFRPSAADGRGKKNQLGPILAAAAMKAGILGALAFKGLALLIGKALLISKIALLLAAVIGLKKLFSHEKHVTYEVVATPHHSHSHGHTAQVEHGHEGHSSGWGRNLGVAPVASGEPHDLAYSAHAPQQ